MTSRFDGDEAKIEDFRLPASTGHTLSFESFRGKVPLVIVFVPDADTSQSTSLLEELDRRHADFGSERAQVLAVTKDTARGVRELADQRGFSIPILADASGAMARQFAVADTGISALVADKEGRIERRWDPLLDNATDPAPMVDSLLDTLRAMDRSSAPATDDDADS
ncbi:MAG: peroxiredoxin family protein [Actinomycetota bacterium]